jgi:hypothetical protein
VDYVKIPCTIEAMDAERNKDSVQAIRNGMGPGHKREGVVLRPLEEFRTNNGARVIVKHKNEEERETKTKRDVNPEARKIFENAKAIAEEWVTPKRLEHVLQKLPEAVDMTSTPIVIKAMVEDVYREGSGEIVESKEATAAIGKATAILFKNHFQNMLKESQS